jgi:glycosyltransferase involved in cell wall biosynthesis
MAAELTGVRVVLVNWRDRAHPLAGGAEEYAHRIAGALRSAGAEVTFLAAQVPGHPSVSHEPGITLVRKGNRWTVYLWALLWLLLHRRSVDVVVDCQNGIPFFSPLVLPVRTAVVLVMHHVHDRQFFVHFPPWLAMIGKWLEGPAARRVYRRAVTVAVSPSTVQALRGRLGWHGPVFVIPNGMDRRTVPVRPRAEEPTLVCLGRLVVHKRVDELIRVAAARPGLRLHVIGRGPEEAALRAAAGPGVTVHGFLDEQRKSELLGESWLNVTLSDGEGWGLAVLEAAAHGVPTLCRNVDGLRDSVRHGETGWLIAPGETVGDGIDAALARLADNGFASGMAKSCQDWAARFDWARTGRRFVSLVDDLLAGRVCREWTAEALVAEFGWPAGADLGVLTGRLGKRAFVLVAEGAGWLLAEQTRAEDVIAALTDAGGTGVRLRPAEEVERLLGGPYGS